MRPDALAANIAIERFRGPDSHQLSSDAAGGARQLMRLTLIYDRQRCSRGCRAMGNDLSTSSSATGIIWTADRRSAVAAVASRQAGSRPGRKLRARVPKFRAPADRDGASIAGVWKAMFGLEQIGVEENFFDLGGHSLLLVQMHGRLREALKTEFSLVTLFEHPTVRSLASHLDSTRNSIAPRLDETMAQTWRSDRSRRWLNSRCKSEEIGVMSELQHTIRGIAIIGMAGPAFPGRRLIEEFWQQSRGR